MKKILVALLVLACMGFVAFAEDAKPALTFGQYSDVSATLNADSFDYGVYNETYLNLKASDMGFSATVVSGADFFATPRNYKVYYNAFGGMVQLAAGNLREGPARLATYIEGNGLSTRLANVKTGLLVTVKPIDGLTAAGFVPVTGDSGATTPVLVPIADSFNAANFGVQYNLTDVANIVAGYRMENKELWVGADVKALKGITAKAGYRMVTGTSSSTSYIYVTGGMAPVENVDVGLDADIVLASTLGYGLEVKGAYTMGAYEFGAKLSYDNGDQWFKNKGVMVNPYAMMNFAVGDIKVGLTYNTGDSTWTVPIECELSY